jgi:hypothetical protein
MSLRSLIGNNRNSPVVIVPASPRPQRVVVAASDDEVKRAFEHFQPKMNDGPVPFPGKRIGWTRTNLGTLAAVFVNELTNKRELWVLDFQTKRRRALLSRT